MRQYFDPAVSDAQMAVLAPALMDATQRFDPVATRRILLRRGINPNGIVPFMYRPLDVRWLYWDGETKLLDEKRPEFKRNGFEGNMWLEARQRIVTDFDRGLFTTALADNLGAGCSNYFPLYLAPDITSNGARRESLSGRARAYLAAVGAGAETLFYHALAVLHAPAYRTANAGALRQDWPRLPPPPAAALAASAALGRQVGALLDVRQPVPGVTHGAIAAALRPLGTMRHRAGAHEQLDSAAGHFGLRARWGTRAHGTVMPGNGRTSPTPDLPGHLDVWLNDDACWGAVPAAVWATTLGGYPVLKKWLSYRAAPVLARDLRLDEVQEFTRLVRRLATLRALAPALDAAYAGGPAASVGVAPQPG